MSKKFVRRGTKEFKRLGKNSKKKQKWRRPRGRDNKLREKKKGRPKKVEIGYKKSKKEAGKIKGKIPILVRNIEDAKNCEKGDLIIISKTLGKKKRQEIINIIKDKVEILNK